MMIILATLIIVFITIKTFNEALVYDYSNGQNILTMISLE